MVVSLFSLKLEERIELYNQAMELRKTKGWGKTRIAKVLNLSDSAVKEWLYFGSKPGNYWKGKRLNFDVWNKGLTKETDKRIKKISEKLTGKKLTKEHIENCKRGLIGKHKSWNRGLTKETDIRIKKYSKIMKKTRKKIEETPELKEKLIKSILKGLIKRPTSFEQKLITLIKKYSLPFDYVGDGKVLINYGNPDFINNNGQKKVIEVYHNYFKIRDFGSCENYEKQRTKKFSKFGFKTLFLNNKDIMIDDWEKNCLNKINFFLQNEYLE